MGLLKSLGFGRFGVIAGLVGPKDAHILVVLTLGPRLTGSKFPVVHVRSLHTSRRYIRKIDANGYVGNTGAFEGL